MKAALPIAALLLMMVPNYAHAAKSCDDLKMEIAQKLDAKNLKGYSLDIVAKDADPGDGKEVGTCEGGAKKIVYHKTAAAPPAAEATPTKP